MSNNHKTNSNQEPKWYKPEPDRKMDLIDHEIFAIAKVHREAIRRNVGLTPLLFHLMRLEYHLAQEANRELLPEERLVAIHLLRRRDGGESTLEILARVLGRRQP